MAIVQSVLDAVREAPNLEELGKLERAADEIFRATYAERDQGRAVGERNRELRHGDARIPQPRRGAAWCIGGLIFARIMGDDDDGRRHERRQ